MTAAQGDTVATAAETSGSPQRTPEWHAQRLGKVTGSRINAVMTGGKGATRAALVAQLVVERLTGKPAESFQSDAMTWGTEQEPFARNAYCAKTGELVEEVGFVPHSKIPMAGCSPDGYVGEEGLVELKCPTSKVALEYIFDRKPPAAYINQMQFQMAVTGRKWTDFCSYDPRLPPHLQLLVIRVYRDEDRIAELEAATVALLEEVESQVQQLQEITL